jgi:hypothetical protein
MVRTMQVQAQREEMLRKAIIDVLRELNGTVIDFYSDEKLRQLEHIIEEKVRQRMGEMCRKVSAYLEWGEEPGWIYLDIDCDKISAHTTLPVYAVIVTNELGESNIEIEEDENES